MKRDKTMEVKVGLFVVVGITLLVMAIFTITGDRSLFADRYILKVKFSQVIGLGPGSVVQVLGFPVGNIEKIEFDHESSKLIVSMNIYKEFQNRIPADSKADVRTKGALGDKYIYIEPGNQEKYLENLDYISANQEPDLLSVLASKGDDVDKIFSIIAKVDRILSDLNDKGEVSEILGDLKATIKNFNKMSSKLSESKIDSELSASIQKISSVLEKIDSGKGSLGALINDPSIHNSLKRILGSNSFNSTLKNQIRSSIKESENTK